MTEKELQRQRAAFIHLGFTEDEIKEVMEADNRIDRGEKLFELTDEQKAASKKARQTTGDKTQYKPKVREKVENPQKQFLIETIQNTLKANAAEILETTNKEREFTFTYDGVKYKLTLSCPRS